MKNKILFLTFISLTVPILGSQTNVFDMRPLLRMSSDATEISKNLVKITNTTTPLVKDITKTFNNTNKIGEKAIKLFTKKSKVWEKLIKETKKDLTSQSILWAHQSTMWSKIFEKTIKDTPGILKEVTKTLNEVNLSISNVEKILNNENIDKILDRCDQSIEKTKNASRDIIFYGISRGVIAITGSISFLFILYNLLYSGQNNSQNQLPTESSPIPSMESPT